MTLSTPAAASDLSPLANAIYEHFEATGRLVRVALELEWTIFTRFIVGVIIATVITVIYLLLTMRNARQPLVIWERLNKPIIKLFRPWIFATLLNKADPYAQSIGKSFSRWEVLSLMITRAWHDLDLRIATFSKGFCTGFMRVSLKVDVCDYKYTKGCCMVISGSQA